MGPNTITGNKVTRENTAQLTSCILKGKIKAKLVPPHKDHTGLKLSTNSGSSSHIKENSVSQCKRVFSEVRIPMTIHNIKCHSFMYEKIFTEILSLF